jgi:hypothetical protein
MQRIKEEVKSSSTLDAMPDVKRKKKKGSKSCATQEKSLKEKERQVHLSFLVSGS